MYRLLSLPLLLLAGLLLAGPAAAQTPYQLHPESRLWIEGSSTVNRFTCDAGTVSGQGRVDARGEGQVGRLAADAGPDAGPDASVAVPIASFDCGNRRMNKDLREAMQSDAHPQIRFALSDARLLREPASANGYHRVQAVGTLTLAGTTRRVELTLSGTRLPDGRLRATGSLPLLMTDFGIEPPTALMGLVKAHDRIEVFFDLVAAPAHSNLTAQ